MRKLPLIFVLLLAVSPFLVGRKKPARPNTVAEAATVEANIPPLIVSASLTDSLPEEMVSKLGLTNVNGTKFKYRSGAFASYFEYRADKEVLLRSLSMTAPWERILSTYFPIISASRLTASPGESASWVRSWPQRNEPAWANCWAGRAICPPSIWR